MFLRAFLLGRFYWGWSSFLALYLLWIIDAFLLLGCLNWRSWPRFSRYWVCKATSTSNFLLIQRRERTPQRCLRGYNRRWWSRGMQVWWGGEMSTFKNQRCWIFSPWLLQGCYLNYQKWDFLLSSWVERINSVYQHSGIISVAFLIHYLQMKPTFPYPPSRRESTMDMNTWIMSAGFEHSATNQQFVGVILVLISLCLPGWRESIMDNGAMVLR